MSDLEVHTVLTDSGFEILQELAGGSVAVGRSHDGGLVYEREGGLRLTSHRSAKLTLLERIGFVRHLAQADPYFPVQITFYGKEYVDGGCFFSGYRPGLSPEGLILLQTPSGLKDISDLVRGFEGLEDAGRLVLSAIMNVRQRANRY